MSLEGILAIAVGLVIGALAITAKVEYDSLAKARTQLGAYSQQVKQDDTALKTAGDSLAAALAAVKQWQDTCALGAAGLTAAQQEIQVLEGHLTESHAALIAAEAKDRATPACAALLNADLAASCPDIASRLRVRPAAPGSRH